MIRIRGEEIARLRYLKGFRSEAALADQAGMSRQHLNRVLRADNASHVTLGTIDKICKALDCDLYELLEYQDAKHE